MIEHLSSKYSKQTQSSEDQKPLQKSAKLSKSALKFKEDSCQTRITRRREIHNFASSLPYLYITKHFYSIIHTFVQSLAFPVVTGLMQTDLNFIIRIK